VCADPIGLGERERRVARQCGGEDAPKDVLAGEVIEAGEVVELFDGRQRQADADAVGGRCRWGW
jgi:hypothetical protein